jgi:hypothetical protein
MEVSGQFHAPAALPPGKKPLVSIVKEAGWAPEPVWTRWLGEKLRAPTEISVTIKCKAFDTLRLSVSYKCNVEYKNYYLRNFSRKFSRKETSSFFEHNITDSFWRNE